jgi:DNA-binding NarL/FixJ family response regulator
MGVRKHIIAAAADAPRHVARTPMADTISTRKTLVVVERQRNMLRILCYGLSKITDIPEGLNPVSSLAAAIALVDAHKPDVVICDESFDGNNKTAPHRLLQHIRKKKPDAKMILFATNFTEQAGPNGYDAVIDRMFPERVQAFVEGIVRS